MERSIRSIACAIVCAGSIMAAGLAAGAPGGYFVVVLGFIGFLLFGLFTIRTVVGTAEVSKVMEFLFSGEKRKRGSDDKD